MIKSIKHRGLKRFYERGDRSGLDADQVPRIEDVLGHLECAVRPKNMDLPGYRLHKLHGELDGFWSIRITGNMRLIFRMDDGDVYDVNLVDYH